MELKVDQKVYFEGENLPYNIMAASDRYAIASRNIDLSEDASLLEQEVEMGAFLTIEEAYEYYKSDAVYSILDLKKNIRGADNWIFGRYDYLNHSDCEKAILDLTSGDVEISRRNACDIRISRIE